MECAYNIKEIGEAIADSLVMRTHHLKGQNDFGVDNLAQQIHGERSALNR